MAKKRLVCALCAITLLCLMAACAPDDNSSPAMAERHPFSLDIAGEDGAEVSWQGYTDGFRPGTTETMQLAVRNNTGQPWKGRLCVQLLEPKPSSVVISLLEQEFDLDSGGGFSREVLADLPADLPAGTYGLALVVRRPGGPSVSVTPIRVGEGEREPFQGEWPTAAALEACPAPENSGSDPAAQPAAFQERFEGSQGRISIDGVEVTDAQVSVRGTSTLPDGACVSAELWAGGVLQDWWPSDDCAPVRQGRWGLTVLFEPGQALESGVQYMVCAYQPGGPDVVSTFPFDLDGPPQPPAGAP